MPRVLILSIATHDVVYDDMKRVLWRDAADIPEGWAHKFVYAGPQDDDPGPGDLVVPGVEESLVPGVARKTLVALRECAADYDYVVRSNLSTLWLWPRLEEYLETAPRSGFVAGTVDSANGDHVCGCCIIMSADVVDTLVTRHWDEIWKSTDPDDVVLTRVCRGIAEVHQLPRLDVLGTAFPAVQVHYGTHGVHRGLQFVTHVRFKSDDRVLDVATMEAFGRVLRHMLKETGTVDVLHAVHLAQCLVVLQLRGM